LHGTQTPVPITTIGGLVTLARPETIPEGASPRNYDWDYLVGSGQTRPGLTSVYVLVDETLGPNSPNAAASATWTNPTALIGTSGFALSTAADSANFITATDFAFTAPDTDSPTGVVVTATAYGNAPINLIAQLLINGNIAGTPKSITLSTTATLITFGTLIDLWGTNLSAAQANALSFGVQFLVAPSGGLNLATAFVQNVQLSIGVNTGTSNFQYITTFTDQQANVRNLSIDADGNFWVENVTADPGTLTLIRSGIADNSLVVSAEGTGVQFFAFGNGFSGIDMPLQYTPNWIDRITQVGPGTAPVFTPQQASGVDYPIVNIAQPPAKSDPGDPGHINTLQQSAGPTSTSPGNTITVFYANSLHFPEDTDLVNAFNSGNPVYVYVSGTSLTAANGTFLVTGIGNATPPGASNFRWYFTYQVTGAAAYQQFGGPDDSPGQYQRTLATLTTTVPVPNLTVGDQITITGNSVSSWNAAWTISQTPNASQMAITGSQVASGVATLNYAVTGASSPPAAGQLVTITNTLNAGGALNVSNATIVSSTGGSTGTFTIDTSAPNASFEAENGLATTAGTVFCFDPGALVAGTTTNPIYGTGTGGDLVFNSTGLFIDPGTYQGTIGFITRNGLWTFPAPPAIFTVPENTTSLQVTNMLLGPTNVVGRYIAITEAGQNGVPGGNFFVLPTPVNFYSQNVKYTATATVINDNISASANLFFTGAVLDSAEAIDAYGYNLFNNIEIGDPGWTISYGARQWFGLCVNKVQSFNNLSFDGGPPSGNPPGWSTPDVYGTVVPSPKFGNSYYIDNTSGGVLTQAGLITQTAYQDAYQDAIIQPNTTYSVRVTVSNPSGTKGGSLVIALVSAGVILGSYTLALSSMTTNLEIYEGTLLTSSQPVIASGLLLEVYAANLAAGADILLDRFDVIPTEIPILTTTVFGSYVGLPEQIDAITGTVGFASENQQPVNGAMVLYDTFYGLKAWSGKTPGSSLYSLQKASDLEPAQWDEPEVAQRSGGAIGPLAFDLGEQWFLGGSRNGLYLFVGGQPGKIMQEIYQVWDAINWQSGQTIWVKVDLDARRIYVGVPLPTPNFWLPNAPLNAAPTSPNVILMCDFKGIDSGEELKGMPQMHTTMFGSLNAIDMRRKWSIWQIPAPYANFVQAANDQEFYICNGRGTSKIYKLDPTSLTDDGSAIDSLYTTAGLPELGKRQQMPQLGKNRVRWGYMTATMTSPGNVQTTLYANRLPGPAQTPVASWAMPGGITPGTLANDDIEASLNFAATRTFVEFRENDGAGGFSLANLVMYGEKDVWNQNRGRTGP
jgi:hypothetical protein